MATATAKPTSAVVKKATAAADKATAKGRNSTPTLRPNDAKLYGSDMAVMSVTCPRCGAKAGTPCTEPAGPRAPHKARIGKSAGDNAKAPTKQAKAGTSNDHEPASKS